MAGHVSQIDEKTLFKSLVKQIRFAKKRGCSIEEIASALNRPEFIIEWWLSGKSRPLSKNDILEGLKKIDSLLRSKVKA